MNLDLDVAFNTEVFKSAAEITVANNIAPNSINREELLKTGFLKTTITTNPEGYVTELVDYCSFDNSVSFCKEFVYHKDNKEAFLQKQTKEQLAIAVKNEDYLRAARLQKQL